MQQLVTLLLIICSKTCWETID